MSHTGIAISKGFPHSHGLASSAARNSSQNTFFTIRSVASDFARLNSRPNSHINGAVTKLQKDDTLTAESRDAVANPKQDTLKPESKEIPLDVLGKGRLVENKLVYRQIFVIRSYEVGFDKSAPIETMTNLFQETALNHVGMMDFVGNGGMGTTHAMVENRLIWIVTRMHIEMIRYPIWGDVVQIDSWVSNSGKNGMRRDFLVRDYCSGFVLARATSNWAMMNQDTRRLSKMPDAVRAEISPWFLERSVMEEDDSTKRIPILDDTAPCRTSGLLSKIHDLDMNQHVNHVKYIDWLLESVPQTLLVGYEPMMVTLEYRRECGRADMVESLARPEFHMDAIAAGESPLQFTHLLRLQTRGVEVLRGRTKWRPKKH